MSQFAIADSYRRPLCVTLLTITGLLALGDSVLATNTTVEGEALIAAQPDNPDAYITASGYARERGELATAVDILERGRARVATSSALLLALGEAYWQLERHDDAVLQFRAAVDAEPSAVTPRCRLVTALAGTGDPQAGLRLCREYVVSEPERAEFQVALGECLERLDRTQEAFVAYGRALELDPTLAPAHSRRGRLLCKMGQHEAAAAACRQALQFDPENALAHAYLGIACSELGRYWEARIHAAAAEQAGLSMESVWDRVGRWEE